MREGISLDELMFFEERKEILPVYLALRSAVLERCGPAEIQVKKTQISFKNRHLFGAASFLPVKREFRPSGAYLTVTFGLSHPVTGPRIAAAVEAYPGRWTHHVAVGGVEAVDEELLSWLQEAAAFSMMKK